MNDMVFKMYIWIFGFMNDVSSKYLIFEMFGFKLNVDGVFLKKK